ncbi:MAG: DUF4258 domain-containing protein [Patescibacteria group bacterium]
MIILFSSHATEALEKRNISKLFVERSVRAPDFEIAMQNDRTAVLKKIDNKFLKIILVKKPTETIIITGYWLSAKRAERLINEN